MPLFAEGNHSDVTFTGLVEGFPKVSVARAQNNKAPGANAGITHTLGIREVDKLHRAARPDSPTFATRQETECARAFLSLPDSMLLFRHTASLKSGFGSLYWFSIVFIDLFYC